MHRPRVFACDNNDNHHVLFKHNRKNTCEMVTAAAAAVCEMHECAYVVHACDIYLQNIPMVSHPDKQNTDTYRYLVVFRLIIVLVLQLA